MNINTQGLYRAQQLANNTASNISHISVHSGNQLGDIAQGDFADIREKLSAIPHPPMDLSGEMVNLIIAEKSHAVNADVVRTQDQMLGTLMEMTEK